MKQAVSLAIRFQKREKPSLLEPNTAFSPSHTCIRFRRKIKKPFPLTTVAAPPPLVRNTVNQDVKLSAPQELTSRITSLLEPYSLRKLSHDFSVLSSETSAFEKTEESGRVPQYDSRKSLAYVGFRMVPVFACVHASLSRVMDTGFSFPARENPESDPLLVLDFGSGPGTASWAAHDVLKKDYSRVETTFVENSLPMIDCAKQLSNGVFDSSWARNLLELTKSYTRRGSARYDLVCASFALGDLASNEARQVTLEMLWGFVREGGLLLVVERGTPRGFKIVGEARRQLIDKRGSSSFNLDPLFKPVNQQEEEKELFYPHVLAPCGHEKSCPLLDNTGLVQLNAQFSNAKANTMPCYFVQHSQRLLKTTTSTRDAHYVSYSYVAVQKQRHAPTEDSHYKNFVRVLRNPIKKVRHVLMDVCGEIQVRQTITKKRDGPSRYKRAKKAKSGDLYPKRVDYY